VTTSRSQRLASLCRPRLKGITLWVARCLAPCRRSICLRCLARCDLAPIELLEAPSAGRSERNEVAKWVHGGMSTVCASAGMDSRRIVGNPPRVKAQRAFEGQHAVDANAEKCQGRFGFVIIWFV
jgi:hypothetical protein